MKAPLIAAMLVAFAASASAGSPATPLASNESLPAQLAHRECEYLPKERIAALAPNAERSDFYARIRRTFFFGIAY